jgi:uncharacterized membrane protein
MAYCTRCGEWTDGEFCPKCGTQAGAVPGRPVSGTGAAAGLGVNVASALCYLFGFVTGILFLVLAPYNRDKVVRFHALQSIFLSVAVAVLRAAVRMLSQMLEKVSFALGAPMAMLNEAIGLGAFGLLVYMMWQSYQGRKVVLPVIGELAERQVSGRGPGSPADTMGKAA